MNMLEGVSVYTAIKLQVYKGIHNSVNIVHR